jgi:hypothetical protein
VSALCVVPITLPESWGGFATNLGVLRFDGETLVVEFQTKDGMFEVLRSDIRRVTLPLQDLTGLAWKAGCFGGTFAISVASLELMKDVPGGDQGRLSLKVRRQDRAAAEQLANEVQLTLASRVAYRIESKESWRAEAGSGRPPSGRSTP